MDEAGWRRLESTRDLGQYLATVRTTQLADWANGFDPEQDCHTFERALRVEWRRMGSDDQDHSSPDQRH